MKKRRGSEERLGTHFSRAMKLLGAAACRGNCEKPRQFCWAEWCAKQTVVARPSNHCTELARDRLYREGGKRERGMIARYDGGCRCKVKIAGLLPRLPPRMAGLVEGGERKGGLWQ